MTTTAGPHTVPARVSAGPQPAAQAVAASPVLAGPAARRKAAPRPVPTRQAGYAHLDIGRLRELRTTLSDEEGKVSYWRRILQARIDVLVAGTTNRTLDHHHLAPVLATDRVSAGRSALLRILPVDDVPPLPSLAELWDRDIDVDGDEPGRVRLDRRPAGRGGAAVGVPLRAARAHRGGHHRSHRPVPGRTRPVPGRPAAGALAPTRVLTAAVRSGRDGQLCPRAEGGD